jgi:hypothetical protein
MKNFLKISLFFVFFILIFIIYLSTIGIETKRLNKQISNKIKNIDENLVINLKEIKIILNPLKLKLNAKTVGSKLIIDGKIIEIESIKTNISLISFINNEFSLDNLEISTRSLEIKNLLSFIREIRNTTQFYILEKIVQKGYLIADIKINFDKDGKIKDDFKINGFLKDTKLELLKKLNIKKLKGLKSKRDYSSIKDVVNKLKTIMLKGKKGHVYNVGSGKLTSNFQILKMLTNKGFEFEKKKWIFNDNFYDVSYKSNNSKFKKLLIK